MKNIIIIIFSLLVFTSSYSQCPKIKGILIDACSTREEINEWMVLTTDTAIVVNNLRIDYDANNNSGGTVNADITSGGCSWITPRTSSIDSLKINTLYNSNIIPVSPGSTIPKSSTILVLTSDSMNFAYNITNLTQYGNVYVIQSSCKRGSGAFTNLGNGANYRLTKIIYNTCRDSVWHYIGNSAVNGHYGVRNRDTMRISYGNIFTSSCNEYMILPIELISFIGNQNDGVNELSWITASEFNNDYFSIERSYPNTGWEGIAKVKGKNQSNLSSYLYYDSTYNDNVSIVYYRLKQVDFDGTISYSNIISITNPILNNYKIESVKFFDVLGQEVKGPLTNSTYIAEIKYTNKRIDIKRIQYVTK